MADASPIVTFLAQRSVEELQAMREKANKVLEDTKIDLDLIDRALEVKQPQRIRRSTKRGDTKKRVIAFIRESADPVSPAEVRDGLNATGARVGASAVYNMIRRLTESGELVRVGDGAYELASRGNGVPGSTRTERTEPLSRATDSQKGPS